MTPLPTYVYNVLPAKTSAGLLLAARLAAQEMESDLQIYQQADTSLGHL